MSVILGLLQNALASSKKLGQGFLRKFDNGGTRPLSKYFAKYMNEPCIGDDFNTRVEE